MWSVRNRTKFPDSATQVLSKAWNQSLDNKLSNRIWKVAPTFKLVHSAFRLLLAVRYRKNLVLTVMMAAFLLGGLYYATAPRRYAAKAGLLITQTQPDRLDTSLTTEEALRKNTMPTFENLIRSAKVLEGALKMLSSSDLVDLADIPRDQWISSLQKKISARAIRSTSILEVGYCSKDPRVAVNIVAAVVQSYLDFMDRMHRGTAGELSRMLNQEREQLAKKLSLKQNELLEARRKFADMGFRSDGKTLHPMVQRAVFFNDALIAAQKKRVEQEALLAAIETAIANGEDLGQYMMSVGDAVGREMLLSSLGLGSRDAYTQASLERSLLEDRSELMTVQQKSGTEPSRGHRPRRASSHDRTIYLLCTGSNQPPRRRTGAKSIGAVAGENGASEAGRVAQGRGDTERPLRGHPRRGHQPDRTTGPESRCSTAT